MGEQCKSFIDILPFILLKFKRLAFHLNASFWGTWICWNGDGFLNNLLALTRLNVSSRSTLCEMRFPFFRFSRQSPFILTPAREIYLLIASVYLYTLFSISVSIVLFQKTNTHLYNGSYENPYNCLLKRTAVKFNEYHFPVPFPQWILNFHKILLLLRLDIKPWVVSIYLDLFWVYCNNWLGKGNSFPVLIALGFVVQV